MRLLSLLALAPALLAADDPREIVRRSLELDHKALEVARNYTFLQREEVRQLDGSGKVKQVECRTWDVTLLEGSPYRRLVARGDRPLSPKEQRQEEDKLRNSIEQRRRESPEQRQGRVADWDRKREKQREPLKELPDAFNFQLAGEETFDGVDTFVIDATPKPGYKPKIAAASFFPKVRARLWISRNDYQWVKLDMETLDSISFGGILLRLSKGSHLLLEQTHVNNEVWLPKIVTVNASGRILMLVGLHREYRFAFSDYKKFQAESRILSTAEKSQ